MLDTKRSRTVERAMATELQRSMKGLHLNGHPRVFFLSHLLHVTEGFDVWGRYGAVFNAETIRASDLYAEVRVGSHRLDQAIDGSLGHDMAERESYNWLVGPQDLTPTAVRYAFWKLTQLKYWEALQEYYEKRKIMVEQHLATKVPSFSREPRCVHREPIQKVQFASKRWADYVRAVSEKLGPHKGLIDPYVRVRGSTRARIYVNSEGSRFVTQERYYEVILNSWAQAADGVYLHASRLFHARSPKDLPTRSEMEEAIDGLAHDMKSLTRARAMDPYAGPALLSGLATGLLFHEAIGHRLEGERLISRSEGHTFSGKVGKRILPRGVDVVDDPTLATWKGQSLFGHYRVDDEGVRAQPAVLVEDGILKGFLTSRTCVLAQRRSNGHGRHERFQDPMARMANLVVKSRDMLPFDELKDRLMKETRDRRLPYGILVKNVSSGETRTDHYDFQAFKGVPTEVYTVDPKSGRETRVRDVNFIGTPLAAIQRIKAFGGEYQVDNSYCFAESGSVPVSTIAPAMLVDELELQRATSKRFRAPILPLPPIA